VIGSNGSPALLGEEKMHRLMGKIALITGGSSGIGRATARRFVAEGAKVIITGRRESELRAAVAELGSAVTSIAGDVGQTADLDRLFAQIEATHGRLDVVFANAGVGEFLPLGSITEEHFDRAFSINVKGTLFLVQKALRLMPDGSSIVLNASIASIKGFPAFSVYAATKAAVRSFARGWAVDLKERRIRVNAISPGTVPTPGYDKLGLSPEQMEGFLTAQSAAIPLGRVGSVEEIAMAALFLASDDSSYVNGIELYVDGGISQI
jgi:NAD(P)-dependent dehydrogenase (short-subunit alcohol dehydrogenase family)